MTTTHAQKTKMVVSFAAVEKKGSIEQQKQSTLSSVIPQMESREDRMYANHIPTFRGRETVKVEH